QRQGELLVMPLQYRTRQTGADTFANAIVEGLDLVLRSWAGAADEVLRPELSQGAALIAAQLGCLAGDILLQRLPRDGQHFQKRPGLLRQALHARPDDLVQFDRSRGPAAE